MRNQLIFPGFLEKFTLLIEVKINMESIKIVGSQYYYK